MGTRWGENGSASIGIAIVDPQPMFRAGIAHLLRSQRGTEIIAEGASAMDALRIAGEKPIDIMLLDLSIPGGGMQVFTVLLADGRR